MKNLRLLPDISINLGRGKLLGFLTLAVVMTAVSQIAMAQESDSSPFSFTLAPVQYANVKGNIGKFEALNWMPNGATEAINDISFVKDINKDISLDLGGSASSNFDNDGHLTLKDGDLAFLQIDYKAFRKYYDDTGAVYYEKVNGTSWPSAYSGVKANSPDLQMDISYFKLEAGIGPITDPYVDVTYEHNSKDGDKSLLQYSPTYVGTVYRKIAPTWESVHDTSDTVNLKESKEFAGITLKGQQSAEVDYNNSVTYMQYINPNTNELNTENESPDAKLYGAGVRAEKWMLNDNTFAAVGYHYNHTHDTDLMQNQVQALQTAGVISTNGSGTYGTVLSGTTLWNYSHAAEDNHVFVGNINSNLTTNLSAISDIRYEHTGSEGNSTYYADSGSPAAVDAEQMKTHQDLVGEHVGLRYSGITHTSLYAETDMEQGRNYVSDSFNNIAVANNNTSDFNLSRLNRSNNESWTVGGRVVPNRFFTFTTQVKQRWEDNAYDTFILQGTPDDQTFLDALKENGIEESSTLTWRPYHWIQNSLKYQFYDTVYMPREAQDSVNPPSSSVFPLSRNHMLTSEFTYEINVQPIDPLLLMISYSHVESYVRTEQASQSGNGTYPLENVPTFNSGDNSWLFSSAYSPTESLTWTNTVCYTISNNYVNFATGVPMGTNFRELNLSTGLDYNFHKWLKIGPSYEYASYRDNSLAGSGNYSANIFMLDAKFTW